MDPISHALFGNAIARTANPPRPRGLVTALVLGSLAPDGDLILVTRGFDFYLRWHARGTHSLVGSIADGLAVALLLRLLIRRAEVRTLFIAAWIGALGHILFDLISGSDMQIFAPLSLGFVGFHLTTFIEPFIVAVLVLAALACWRWRAQSRAIAATALALLLAFVLLKYGAQLRARSVYSRAMTLEAPAAARISALPNRILEWRIDDRTANRVRAWRVLSFGEATLLFERTDAPPSQAIAASRNLPAVRTFLALDGIPFVRTEREDDHLLVLWSDVRHCSADACDVSFGGAFDDAGRALYQVIEVGPKKFKRPIS